MMHEQLLQLMTFLNDLQYHDGTTLGEQLNMTRSGVWKIIKKLQGYGIALESTKGLGYRLTHPLILLDSKKIKKKLQKNVQLVIEEKVNSTNTFIKRLPATSNKMTACMAEMQTAGRGRLQRSWYSPFGQNIYASFMLEVTKDISTLSGLSLVVGLAICKAIDLSCQPPLPLNVKWPNDVMAEQAKLAGTLIEIQAESNGFCSIIIGIGINVNMLNTQGKSITQDWTSLQKLTRSYHDRNIICAGLINILYDYVQKFLEVGLHGFLQEWHNRDYLLDRDISLLNNQLIVTGKMSGINEKGHLLLTTKSGKTHDFSSGDTSLL